MTISPKLGGIAAGVAVLALLAGYFFFWRPSQPPPPLSLIQEKTISDLEAANEKAYKERESLKRQAREAAGRATRAETEAAKARARLRELEAQFELLKPPKGAIVTTEAEAIKELKAMGWLR